MSLTVEAMSRFCAEQASAWASGLGRRSWCRRVSRLLQAHLPWRQVGSWCFLWDTMPSREG